MKELNLGFGRESITVQLDEKNIAAVLLPQKVQVERSGIDEVRYALDHPIGTPRLRELARGKRSIVIITSDITRPVPSYKLLPSVLQELEEADVDLSTVTVVFALGSHRGHTEEEKKKLVGEEVYRKVRCIDSDPDQVVHMGDTHRGTPVDVFETVAKAQMRICLANVEYHYFAGYSGGYKTIMPGVSTREAIQKNHRFMIEPAAHAGALEGNPVREDIEEAGRICGVDFILNVVLDSKKEIIKAVAGDPILAHREGCAFLDKLYKCPIEKKADIVLVSPGGFPKDINLYQAQKALDNAGHAVRDGGVIIWVASCKEGFGESHFEQWMTGHQKSSDMIEHIRREFILGGHKAAAIAMILQRAKIILVSDLAADLVRSIFLEPANSVEEALRIAFKDMGNEAKVIVMPYGGSTLPVVKE